MSATLRRTCQLPHGFEVEFTLSGSRLDVKWSPRMPYGKRVQQLLPHYRRERDAFLASTGSTALVIEI